MIRLGRRPATLLLALAWAGVLLWFSQRFLFCFPAPKLLAVAALTALAWAFAGAAEPALIRAAAQAPFTPALAAVLAWELAGLAASRSPEAPALALLPVAGASAAAWLAAALASQVAERNRLLGWFAAAHLLAGLYGAVQYFGQDPWTWTLDYGPGRVFATVGNPNFLAGQFVLALPVLVALGSSGRPRVPAALAWLARAAFALGALAFICAQTRGAWLGLIAGAAVAALAWTRKVPGTFLNGSNRGTGAGSPSARPILWAAVTAAVLVGWFSAPSLNPTGISLPAQIASSAELGQQSARQRFFWWRAAFELDRAAPVAGWGTANFIREFPARARRVAPAYSDLPPAYCDHPHQDYLYVTAEHGLVGLGLLLWLALIWCRLAWHRWRREGDPLGLGVLAAAVGIAVHANWNMPSIIPSTLYTAAALLGLVAARPGPEDPAPAVAPAAPRFTLRLGAGLAVALGIALRPAVLMTAQCYLNGARILSENRAYPPAAYQALQTLRLTRAPWRTSFMLGGIYYGEGYYEQALAAFAADEKENPWGADAILHQGKALRQLGRYDEADAQSRRALALVPNYPEAAVTIASLAYARADAARKAGHAAEQRHQLRRATVWLRYALAFFPRNAEALKLTGYVAVMEKDWPGASAAWEAYLRVKPLDDDQRNRLEALRRDMPRLLKLRP